MQDIVLVKIDIFIVTFISFYEKILFCDKWTNYVVFIFLILIIYLNFYLWLFKKTTLKYNSIFYP